MRTWKRAATALVIAGALGLAAGCGGGDEVTVKTSDGAVKVDRDGDGFQIEGEDGTKVVGGSDLPDGFPDEVELVDGKILQAMSAMSSDDAGGFTVSLEADGDLEEVFADAKQKLTGAGFTSESSQTVTGSMMMGSFENADWQVLLQVAPSSFDDKVTANYTVVEKS